MTVFLIHLYSGNQNVLYCALIQQPILKKRDVATQTMENPTKEEGITEVRSMHGKGLIGV